MRAMVLAYGNTDRQDDGVAWHILHEVAGRLNLELPESPLISSECSLEGLTLRYVLQLTPELAGDFAGLDKIVFVDAHTGNVAEDIHIEPLAVQYQSSPLTHHLTPSSCLAIAHLLNGSAPEALLVSVRGHKFGFTPSLSPETAALVPIAADAIMEWIG